MGVAGKLSGTVSPFRAEQGTSLETPSRARASSCQEVAGKVGNPFQTKHGSRPSSRNQEGRSGSDEVIPGTSVFPSRETRVLGNFWNRIKGAKFSHLKCENTSRRNLGLLFRRWSGQGQRGLAPRSKGTWALSLPDKELCLREALAVCTPLAPEPSAKRPGS